MLCVVTSVPSSVRNRYILLNELHLKVHLQMGNVWNGGFQSKVKIETSFL